MVRTVEDTTSLFGSTIEKLHEVVAQDLSTVFEFPVTIEDSEYRDRMDWERLRNPIYFNLRARQQQDERMSFVSDPTNGERHVVLWLGPDPSVERANVHLNWWVGWHEKWVPSTQIKKRTQFALHTAAWRLYCRDNDDQDILLVRAEWDRPDENRPQNAAQPHWHVHHRQKIGVIALSSVAGQAERILAEMPVPSNEDGTHLDDQEQLHQQDASALTVPPARYIEITDIHLGMAGWRNEGQHPKCWQFPFGNLQNDVHTWAVATLRYMRSQLCYVRLAEAV